MNEDPLSRRDFFRHSFAGIAQTFKETAVALWSQDEMPAPKPEFIRPPGALPEEEFLQKCTRCNECVRICPEQSVMKFVGEGSVHHLTPILSLRTSACVLCEDFPCVRVCEPQALVMPPSTSQVKMGVAVINTKLCHAWQGMDCDYCVKECPFPGVAIRMDESRRPHILAEHCVGCGLCEHICPSRQPAIVVKRR